MESYLNSWPIWGMTGIAFALAGLNWICGSETMMRMAFVMGQRVGFILSRLRELAEDFSDSFMEGLEEGLGHEDRDDTALLPDRDDLAPQEGHTPDRRSQSIEHRPVTRSFTRARSAEGN